MSSAMTGLYFTFTRAIIQKQMAYRANYIFSLIASPLFSFVNYYLWKAVFDSSSSDTLSGFDIQGMIVYLFLMPVINTIMAEGNGRTISEEVKSGLIAIQLIKPYSYRMRLFGESMGRKLPNFLFLGLPMLIGLLIYQSVVSHDLPDWIHVGRFLLSLGLGVMVSFYFWYLVGLLSFYTTNMWGSHLIIFGITMIVSGRLFPLDFLPHWARVLFSFFPQQSSYYVPAMAYMGQWSSTQYWHAVIFQAGWVMVLGLISTLVWHRAIRRLTILGG